MGGYAAKVRHGMTTCHTDSPTAYGVELRVKIFVGGFEEAWCQKFNVTAQKSRRIVADPEPLRERGSNGKTLVQYMAQVSTGVIRREGR
jgi:hypothetical protein